MAAWPVVLGGIQLALCPVLQSPNLGSEGSVSVMRKGGLFYLLLEMGVPWVFDFFPMCRLKKCAT